MIADAAVPVTVLEQMAAQHRRELATERMRLVRYRTLLLENGIEPPDDSGADLLAMWDDCRNVIRVAQTLVANLGTSKEMLARFS